MAERIADVIVKVSSCNDCPYKTEINGCSTDGWDYMVDWICTKMSDKRIKGAVEWYEANKIEIPEWCPFLRKE